MLSFTRRAALAGGLAAAAAPASAQPAGPYAAAAAYSAAREGVSFLVRRAGTVLAEDYPNGGAPDAPWELASGTKSFWGVAAAAAVQDRMLSLDERCAETLREWRSDERKRRITLRDLLTLTSGLEASANLRPPGYAEAVAAASIAPPGAVFSYGAAPFQIFGEILRRKLAASGAPADPVDYLRRRVLTHARAEIGEWRRGQDGQPLMPQGAALTARAWARFGDFVLRGGDGRLDAAALAACFASTPANPGYGLTWWLLRPGLLQPSRSMPIAIDADFARRHDVRMAAGAGDQRLYLVPAQNLVIVRQARISFRRMMSERRSAGRGFSDTEFLRLVLEVR